jgi:uncharacterized nucleotidyltransferase DUF6036
VAARIEKWTPSLNWNSAAGRTLLLLVAKLPKGHDFKITVFGSAPLQLCLDANFLSADIDIFAEEDFTDLIRQNNLGEGQCPVYIQQCAPSTFATAADWPLRAHNERVENVEFCFPHPIDILVGKLGRLEEKDIRAFELVRNKMGLPTEEQLTFVLMNAVDLFRPRFDEEKAAGDMLHNTRTIWTLLYGKEIDVRAQIIAPALKRRKYEYGSAGSSLKDELRSIKKN